MTTDLFLGVDGGGTSTTAWLADSAGRVLGRGVAGPSNAKAISLDAAPGEALDHAIRSAFFEAGIEIRPVAVACLGLAGFDRPDDRRRLEAWAAVSPWNGRLASWSMTAIWSSRRGRPDGFRGVGLIAGTGSIAVGRDREGRTARAGGWGYLFGDEG